MRNKYAFIVGTGSMLTVSIVAFILQHQEWIFMISGGISIIGILMSGLLLGAFLNGQETRATYHSETSAHRAWRLDTALLLILFALPHITAAMLYIVI
ncbi:DUF5316 family protein [Bacillus sp. Bos-x628]|uniref:DUF5316 family protein n=1 Tax=Bacillus maqinnsis TaxID=3229854 RepID=UPI00338D69C9